jgi:hypothetical protein
MASIAHFTLSIKSPIHDRFGHATSLEIENPGLDRSGEMLSVTTSHHQLNSLPLLTYSHSLYQKLSPFCELISGKFRIPFSTGK